MAVPTRSSEELIVIPPQDTRIKIAPVDYEIKIPREWRRIEVEDGANT